MFILLAVPCIAERFFEPQSWVVRNVAHQILGSSAGVSGVKSPLRAELQILIAMLMLIKRVGAGSKSFSRAYCC